MDRIMKTARIALWSASDRLCERKVTFGLGNALGELGWRLRDPLGRRGVPEYVHPLDEKNEKIAP